MADQRKLRQNVGLENMDLKSIMTSQTTHPKYKWHTIRTPLNAPPHENILRTRHCLKLSESNQKIEMKLEWFFKTIVNPLS